MKKEYNKVDAINDVRDKLVKQVREQIKLTGNPYECLEVNSEKDLEIKLNKLNKRK